MSAAEQTGLPEVMEELWLAYRQGDCPRGILRARQATRTWSNHGEPWFALACLVERSGDLLTADRCFARASRAAVEPQPSPFRVGWPRFTRIVDSSAQVLPPRLRDVLGEVTLVLADYAEDELIADQGEPELLGLFVGVTRGDTLSAQAGSLSPRIYLFRRAHEHNATSAREFTAEVTQTLYHELGHYIGYDEDGLDELGMG